MHFTRAQSLLDASLVIMVVLIYCLSMADTVVAEDWGYYGATPGGLKYSSLDQINRNNVSELELAWTYQTGDSKRVEASQQAYHPLQLTPIQVGDLLVGCTPLSRVFALDKLTGKERWHFDPKVKPTEYGATFIKCRSVSSWVDNSKRPDEHCQTRIIYGTGDFRIFALDANNGQPCTEFGSNGEIVVEADKELVFKDELQFHSPPVIVNDVAIFGSTMADIFRVDSPSGKVRAFSARSGKLLWEFDPIPKNENDPATSTWGKESAKRFGAANVWSFLSADPENNLVFLPTSTPSVDWYGVERPGDNRYANSLVALDASTGEVVWHFQISHHDIWDYDLSSQPILTDIEKDGKRIPAVIQLTKQSMVFIFNRLNGEPLFPIEERAVPQSTDIAGERLSPTQPFTKVPASLVDHHLTEDELWGLTWFDRRSCRNKFSGLRNEGIYTPPSQQGTLLFPAGAGGMNWGGGAVDPDKQLLVVPTLHIAAIVKLVPRENADSGQASDALQKLSFPLTGTPYVGELSFLTSFLGIPCTKPPWARLSAIDLRDGSLKWQVALGSIEKQLPFPVEWELGTPFAGGPIVTAGGLTFMAGTTDDKIRAFDVETGEKLWQKELPAGGQATPMTYAANGKQFVVIAAGGHPLYQTTPGDYIVAYALKN